MAAIYLIRHGQASWGKPNYDELSELGVRQATVLGEALRRRVGQPDHVVSGAMRRHQQTALHVLTAMGLSPQWHEDHRWNEYDHVQMLDRISISPTALQKDTARDSPSAVAASQTTVAEESAILHRRFQELFEQSLLRWIGGQNDGEYAESWPDFKNRVAIALQATLDRQGDTLVFTSGGTISAVVRQLWQMPDSSWPQVNRVIANAAVTKLVIGKRGLHLSTFNDHSPFEGQNRHLLTYR